MKLTRCEQGHFYDAEKYPSCPHCTSSAPAGEPSGEPTRPSVSSVPPTAPVAGSAPTMPSPSAPPVAPSAPPAPSVPQVDDVQKTRPIFVSKMGDKEPVVGWLVCVEGPHFGEDFRIKMGRNFIGRQANMDIALSKDNSVSRDRHCIVVYEPKGNMFIVQAGDSKELSYLNDRVILSPQELKAYDTIKMGESALLFVPFCSESFKWDDIKKDDNKD